MNNVNDDHAPDLIALTGTITSQISILFNKGDGTFMTPSTSDSFRILPITLSIGDLDNDKKLDLVVVNLFTTTAITVLFNYGNGTFMKPIQYQTDEAPYFLSIADMNNDDKLDIVVGYVYSNNISILFN
ncbi:unnamed protein product, partial [Adineta ricciae]